MMTINIFDTEIFPYLEGEALVGSTLSLTIRDIKIEEMKSHKGKSETKYVLYFRENQKGFVLNKTNAKRIAQMYGPTTDGWEGKEITLYTEKVQAFGETHNALRVAQNAVQQNGGMNLVSLLALLKKVEVKGMDIFYQDPDDILACRAKGAPLPSSDDTEGWRVLFADARDYAIDRINEAVERGDLLPGEQAPMPLAEAVEAAAIRSDTAMPGQYFGEKDYGPEPPNFGNEPQIEADQTDIDKIDEDKRADELWTALEANDAPPIVEEPF